ncbi:MAG: rhodanese-like domain-containing protein [Eubacterium sp.]|nr:rhodanese-like domain-containing protein [Eubacterium sp.]
MNDNYILVANGDEVEVYKDGEFFVSFLLNEVYDTDYPKPFFEALEASTESEVVDENSAGDAEEDTSDIGTYKYVEVDGYKQITAATAQKIMENETGYVIVDVRTDTEYYDGHIPDAILVSNEYIEDKAIPELPNMDQMILVYCRSGRRSKDAAKKLAAIGYTNVYEFGGIIYWPGPTTTEF